MGGPRSNLARFLELAGRFRVLPGTNLLQGVSEPQEWGPNVLQGVSYPPVPHWYSRLPGPECLPGCQLLTGTGTKFIPGCQLLTVTHRYSHLPGPKFIPGCHLLTGMGTKFLPGCQLLEGYSQVLPSSRAQLESRVAGREQNCLKTLPGTCP